MVEERKAQVRERILRNHHGEIELAVSGPELSANQAEINRRHLGEARTRRAEQRGQPCGRRHPSMGQEKIDDQLNYIGLRQRECGVERHQQNRQEKHSAIGAYEGPDELHERDIARSAASLFLLELHA